MLQTFNNSAGAIRSVGSAKATDKLEGPTTSFDIPGHTDRHDKYVSYTSQKRNSWTYDN